jgi:Domain of unknown function (DUF4783)
MPRILRYIIILTTGLMLMAFDVTVDEILGAIKKGDAEKISQHFDNLVEITVQEKTFSYSKSQAEMVLRDFFGNNNVRSFKMIHRGYSNDSEYCVGLLSTSHGEYRTTLLVKFRAGRKLVQEIRFE